MSEGGRRKKDKKKRHLFTTLRHRQQQQQRTNNWKKIQCVYREGSFHGLYFSAGINKDFFHVYSGGTPIQEVNARMAKLIFNTWMCVCVCDCVTIFRSRTRNNQTRAPQNFVVGKESRRCGLDSFPHGDTQNGGNSWSPTKKRSWKIVYLIVELVGCIFLELLGFLWTGEMRSLWFSDLARRPTTAVDERPWNRSRLAFLSRPGLAHRYAFSTGQVCVVVQHVTSYVYVCVCVSL